MPEITQYVLLPDGTYAAIVRQVDYGQLVIILLLVAIVFLQVLNTWRRS